MQVQGLYRASAEADREFNKMEDISIPDDIDYFQIKGLRSEAKERLTAIRPTSVGQAARISGVTCRYQCSTCDTEGENHVSA